jgi:large subunit ribosomal protein L22
MEAKAITRYIRIAPRKMRIVIDTVRYQPVSKAFATLDHLKKKAAKLASKTLKSAVANAKVKKMDEARLYVREIKADGGPTLKRHMSRSMGRADVILKRMTHLTVVLGERELPVSAVQAEPKEKKSKEKGTLPAKEKKAKKTLAAPILK